MTTTDLKVRGMTCASCVAHVERGLERLDGVRATVNLATETAHVEHPDAISEADLVAAVAATGYSAIGTADGHDHGEHDQRHEHDHDPRALGVRVLVSVPLAVAVLVLAMAPGVARLPWLQLVLAAPVVLWAGLPFHRAALAAARHRTSTMDTLVSLGTLAAFTWSLGATITGRGATYVEVAATVTTFLLLGRWAEGRARVRAGSALRSLLELGTKRAVLVDARGEREVDVIALRPGDRVVVRPGAQVPTDARVLEGESSLDESMVTGESLPVRRGPGDALVGATLNLEGRLVAEVTGVGEDTVLARLASAVRRAQEGKAPVQRLADRVSAVFVPVVLVIAALTLAGWLVAGASWSHALAPAIAVLVVACPCALGLATPTALLVGTGRAAQLGIVVRDAAVLETARRIRTVVLDKTGTVTTGQMTVHERLGDQAVWALAAAAESASDHPVARAIAALTDPATPVESVVERAGRGVEARVAGHEVEVAAAPTDLAGELGAVAAAARAAGRVAVLVRVDGEPVAVAGVGDVIKDGASALVRDLHRRGVRTVLLTGDHERAARALGAELGVDEVEADVRPEEKAERVASLRRREAQVAMVGDGVNDAAALAEADLGIALGTGTSVAIEAAEMVLMNGDPQLVVTALDLAGATVRVIRQNLAWAFGYNVVGIPLAATGLLDPMIAGAAMAASSVCVVLNALRLRRVGG